MGSGGGELKRYSSRRSVTRRSGCGARGDRWPVGGGVGAQTPWSCEGAPSEQLSKGRSHQQIDRGAHFQDSTVILS